MLDYYAFARDTINESLSDFLKKRQTPGQALWSLRSIDLRAIALRAIALHTSFGNLHKPRNASLLLLISAPIRIKVFSFVNYKRKNSQNPEKIYVKDSHFICGKSASYYHEYSTYFREAKYLHKRLVLHTLHRFENFVNKYISQKVDLTV